MTEQIKEPSEHNRMAALQLIARQSVTRLAEILDSKDEAIATARKERDEARAEVERLTPKARLWESDEALRLARGVRRQARLHRTRIDLLAAQDEAHIQAQRDTPPSSAERMAALDAAAAARARAAKEKGA